MLKRKNNNDNNNYESEQNTIIHLALETNISQTKIYNKLLKNVIHPLANYLTIHEENLDPELHMILNNLREMMPYLLSESEKGTSNAKLIEFMSNEIESKRK